MAAMACHPQVRQWARTAPQPTAPQYLVQADQLEPRQLLLMVCCISHALLIPCFEGSKAPATKVSQRSELLNRALESSFCSWQSTCV